MTLEEDIKHAQWQDAVKKKPPLVMRILVKLHDGSCSYGAIDYIDDKLKLVLYSGRFEIHFDTDLVVDTGSIKEWSFLPRKVLNESD